MRVGDRLAWGVVRPFIFFDNGSLKRSINVLQQKIIFKIEEADGRVSGGSGLQGWLIHHYPSSSSSSPSFLMVKLYIRMYNNSSLKNRYIRKAFSVVS